MIYTKQVDDPWFRFIQQGRKKVEGRLNKGDFCNMKHGDIIQWYNNNNNNNNKDTIISTKIVRITYYKTFEEYLQKEGLENTLPEITSIIQGLDIYYQYYTREKEIHYGVLGIELERIE